MAHRTARTIASRDAAPAPAGSTTGATAPAAAARAGDADASVAMFGELPDPTRSRMELVARASVSAEVALPAIIAITTGATGIKQDTIVTAIMNNRALREQWERTWEVLRR